MDIDVFMLFLGCDNNKKYGKYHMFFYTINYDIVIWIPLAMTASSLAFSIIRLEHIGIGTAGDLSTGENTNNWTFCFRKKWNGNKVYAYKQTNLYYFQC